MRHGREASGHRSPLARWCSPRAPPLPDSSATKGQDAFIHSNQDCRHDGGFCHYGGRLCRVDDEVPRGAAAWPLWWVCHQYGKVPPVPAPSRTAGAIRSRPCDRPPHFPALLPESCACFPVGSEVRCQQGSRHTEIWRSRRKRRSIAGRARRSPITRRGVPADMPAMLARLATSGSRGWRMAAWLRQHGGMEVTP